MTLRPKELASMLITNAALRPKRFRFSEDFLSPYYKEGDPFQSLLARSTYLNKYCRDKETWTDTIRRVVEANLSMAASTNEQEAKILFHLFWTGQALPPGRGLWTGGVEGIPADARYNCWFSTLHGIDDWCWTANQLMLGGGVGVGLGEIDTLPVVQREPAARFSVLCSEIHPDVNDVNPNAKSYLNGQTPIFKVPDSREGWVEALRTVLTSAFNAKDLIVDVSEVRARGMPIRTFGGIACGPGPLTNLLRNSWLIVRGAAGRRLNSVEALDITNYIGLCIKAGNVRRSALIAIGDAYDQAFRDAKKDMDKVISHRHTSNNTIAFRSWEQLDNFDWDSLVRDMAENGSGEPGILNLPLVWRTDPEARGVNPCFSGDTQVAIADGRNSVPIRQLAEEGRDVPVYSMDPETGKVEIKMGRNPRVTGYAQDLVRVWLDDGSYLDVTPNHEFILREGQRKPAHALVSGDSLPRYQKGLKGVVKGGRDYYLVYGNTRDPGGNRVFEHRLIAKFSYPDRWDQLYNEGRENGWASTGGVVVHHRDYNPLNNSPDNLEIMTFQDHTRLHGSADTQGERNGRWSGFSSEQLKSAALELTSSLGRRFSKDEWMVFAEERGMPVRFSDCRVSGLGSLLGLAKACASELGLEYSDEDPRVVRTYQSMLSQGYDTRILSGRVLVKKTCERCSKEFETTHDQRENSFCSNECGTAYVNSDKKIKTNRVAGMNRIYSARMSKVRDAQARVCSAFKFRNGRNPNRREWSLACKSEGVPSRIGPTLKFGFKHFNEVLESGANYNHKVVRVEKLPGKHTVYNITVDDYHTVGTVTSTPVVRGKITLDGIFAANCGEVPLADREACNLAEVFPAKFESATDPDLVFKLITRYCLRQRLAPLLDERADAIQRKNMRVGVGLGGLCDFSWTEDQLSYWYKVCREEATNYATELGVSNPIAVTTVKPSGTISLLNGSSPGIHAPYAAYYLRRTRIAKNDPMALAMAEAGVPFEDDVYDKSGHTWVFAFPMKSLSDHITVQNETVRDQFNRQKAVQSSWADNAVSATISFAENEREELASCFKEYVPFLKSTSTLPKSHGYAQAPYSECSKEEYERLYTMINHKHPLVRGGDFEVEECSSGSCPIR